MSRVHVGIPSHDGKVHVECMLGVLDAWSTHISNLNVVRGSFLPRSRDRIVSDFLADLASPTHLLCVDADIEWRRADLERLLELRVEFAFGMYVGKDGAGVTMMTSPVEVELSGHRVWEVDRCGAGFVLLTRSAVERMAQHYGASDTYRDGQGRHHVGLWQTDGRVERDGVMVAEGEDFAFCRRWRALGGRILTRPDVRLGHVGQHVYR